MTSETIVRLSHGIVFRGSSKAYHAWIDAHPLPPALFRIFRLYEHEDDRTFVAKIRQGFGLWSMSEATTRIEAVEAMIEALLEGRLQFDAYESMSEDFMPDGRWWVDDHEIVRAVAPLERALATGFEMAGLRIVSSERATAMVERRRNGPITR